MCHYAPRLCHFTQSGVAGQYQGIHFLRQPQYRTVGQIRRCACLLHQNQHRFKVVARQAVGNDFAGFDIGPGFLVAALSNLGRDQVSGMRLHAGKTPGRE